MSSISSEALELLDLAVALEPDALDIVLTMAKRLKAGQEVYGRLDVKRDKRNFSREALEEAIDGFVYVAAKLKQQLEE